MNKKIVTEDNLPDCWIKRQSKSRPDHIYYYNTATRQSQWTLPVNPGDKQQKKQLTVKGSAESPKRSDRNDPKNLKISNSSKLIKKSQTKTPAQDRLQNLAKQLKNASPTKVRSGNEVERIKDASKTKLRTGGDVVERLKSATQEQCRVQNFDHKNRNESEQSKVIKKANANKSKLKDVQNVYTPTMIRVAEVRTPHKPFTNGIMLPDSSDGIPSLFPPSTPGQNRLNRLRNSLNPEQGTTPSESAQLALSVIQTEFGLSSATLPSPSIHNTTTIDEDEPMDWEPCDIFEEVENVVCNELKRACIVPDTNVFLDELSCIRDTVRRDSKYNVLVPFVVLQELDRLKSRTGDSRISNLASAAIRFIFNELKSMTQRLQGQKATEDCSHLIDVQNADDKILNCCLQLLGQSRETILISNDINLCNKAIASGVPTMTSKEYKAIH